MVSFHRLWAAKRHLPTDITLTLLSASHRHALLWTVMTVNNQYFVNVGSSKENVLETDKCANKRQSSNSLTEPQQLKTRVHSLNLNLVS